MSKKRHLGPQNGSGSSGPEKLLKIVSYDKTEKTKRDNGGGPSGIGGWPPISTWIKDDYLELFAFDSVESLLCSSNGLMDLTVVEERKFLRRDVFRENGLDAIGDNFGDDIIDTIAKRNGSVIRENLRRVRFGY